MTQARSLIKPHYPALNGMRGLAIIMVFTVHYGRYAVDPKWIWWLWTGVDLFFVLSGFLITGILYDSREEPRYFRNFYIRRALRIFPLYYGFFLLVYLLKPLLGLSFDHNFWSNLVYLEGPHALPSRDRESDYHSRQSIQASVSNRLGSPLELVRRGAVLSRLAPRDLASSLQSAPSCAFAGLA